MSDLLSFDEIRILSHALGYPRNYRNNYSCDPSVSTFPTLQSLAARGYLHEDTTFDQFNRTFTRYSVTAKGKLYLDDLHAALMRFRRGIPRGGGCHMTVPPPSDDIASLAQLARECAECGSVARQLNDAIRDRDIALAIARGDAPRFVIGSTDGDGWIIMDLVEDDEDSCEYVNANLSFVCATVDKMQRDFSPPTTKKKAKT